MLIHFISLFLLKRLKLTKVGPSDHIQALANLVMHEHGQGALEEALSLENSILQLLELCHVSIEHYKLLLVFFKFFEIRFDSNKFLVINLQVLQDLLELSIHLDLNVLAHTIDLNYFLIHEGWHLLEAAL